MATKFRNSFFGFNKDDVMSYVLKTKETQNKNEQTIQELKTNVESLNTILKQKDEELLSLKDNLVAITEELEDYRSREAVLTKLSESIGKLYLVAQTNAKTIIDSAKENAIVTEAIVKDNLATAESTKNSLSNIEAELIEKTEKFTAELAQLKEKLEAAKSTVSNNNTEIKQSEAVLDNLIESVDAGLKV